MSLWISEYTVRRFCPCCVGYTTWTTYMDEIGVCYNDLGVRHEVNMVRGKYGYSIHVMKSMYNGGGFSISIDLEHYSTAGTIRHLGIAVGMSKAEAEGWAHNVPTGFTYADLFVGYRGNQSAIQVFENGTEVINNATAGDASTLPKKLKIDFTCSDFNVGSTVNYKVTFGGAAMGTGSFTWSGTNENYIGVYSNLFPASGTTGQLDDFSVSALMAEPPLAI